MDFLIDLYQSGQITGANAKAQAATDRLSDVQDAYDRLSRRIDRMALVNAALWELLRERTGLSDQELQTKVLEIDARDGKVDGRMGGTKQICPSCGKVIHPKHQKCLYCGTAQTAANEFAKV